jgi:tetratricopeptide (TPR) repeat protein
VRFEQGDAAQAVQLAKRALGISKNNEVLFCAANLFVETGDLERAGELAEELSRKIESEPQVYGKLIEGQVALAKGDKSGAIRILHEGQDLIDTWIGRFILGSAYLAAEAYPEAHSEFELCLKRRGEAVSVFLNDLPSYRYFPPVHYYLGRALQGLGSAAAADSYRTFLKIKDKADPGEALVKDARARLSDF